MQTDTETPQGSHWQGWRFRSEAELQEALEQYASFEGVPLVRRYGDIEGGDSERAQAAHECVMRQNVAIDTAMRLLRRWYLPGYRILHAYYRCGLSYEADGWQRAIDRVTGMHDEEHRTPCEDLYYHCQTARERDRQRRVFEMLVSWAVVSLWHAHEVHCGRTLDAGGGMR